MVNLTYRTPIIEKSIMADCERGKKYIYFPSSNPNWAFADNMHVGYTPLIKCPRFAGGLVNLKFDNGSATWKGDSTVGGYSHEIKINPANGELTWFLHGCADYELPLTDRQSTIIRYYLGGQFTACCDVPNDSTQLGLMTLFTQGCPIIECKVPPDCCDCNEPCIVSTSDAPVRYNTGELMVTANDLSAGGYGIPWGHARSFSNQVSPSTNIGNGFNWFVPQWSYLDIGPSTVVVMQSGSSALWFDLQLDGSYLGRFNIRPKLRLDAGSGHYVLTDADGSTTEYTATNGSLVGRKTPAGAALTVISTTTGGNPLLVQRTYTSGSNSTVESFTYTYASNTGYPLDLLNVTMSRQVNFASPQNVLRAVYTYYGSDDAHGDQHDLKTATTGSWQNGAWVDSGTSYYRYWSNGSSSSSSSGGASGDPLHLLKFVLNAGAYQRMVDAGYNPTTANDATLLQFSDYYFEFDSQRRVSLETVKSGSQTFEFSYTDSGFPDDLKHWQRKTTETLPDSNHNIVYTNYAGQQLLKVLKSGDNQWIDFWAYDANANNILHAHPSAVSGYDEIYPDLLNFDGGLGTYEYLRDDEGLIDTYTHHVPSGNLASELIQQGQLDTPILVRSRGYCQCGSDCACGTSSSSSSSSSTHSMSLGSSTGIWLLAKSTQYPSDTDPSRTIDMNHCYTFYTGTCAVQQHVTTLPVISTDQNGSGVANTNREYFDDRGNLTWKMDERGFITRMAYDIPTGAMTQLVQDVDTSLYIDAPAGWTTPSGGGLNLVTDSEHDSQGRTTQSLGPSHSIDLAGTAITIRTASWTVYDDANFVTYSGQGYATGTSPSYTFTLVNPVSITKMDANGRVNEQIQAAAATTAGTLAAIISAAGGGAAAFPQTSYTRWTTNQYTDCCLAASQRVYHTIPTLGPGSSGTNYDETDFGYDIMKRRNRTVSPGGTITDIVFDPRGLGIGTYIGTNDDGATENDPAGGGTNPSNNMVIVTGNQYDDGLDGGDGNLTAVTQSVDSSNTRLTGMTYDFRNRRVTMDGEIDYFQKVLYDNLNRMVKTDRYDTTEGGPLIGRRETKFDDQGRVYRTIRYGIDPTNGTVGYGLTDNTWYDQSGNVIKSLPAGSSLFSKTTIDSLGRPTIRYSGYDLSETSYADALTVTNDVILEQAETAYDAANNVIQTTARQRYHNAPDMQKGVLQNPSTTPKARVTYLASWHDEVGRTVANANYGTNGGTALSRPNTIPVSSDSVLIARITFDSAGNLLDTTDPAGMVTRFGYDAVGRTILKIDNYKSTSSSSSSSSSSGGSCAPSDDVNRTTEFTFTRDGQQATLIAVNTRTGDQTTTWTYGTTLSNSDIASSQLLLSVTYPDSTGGSDLVSYAYNRQGQTRGMTDQRSCVHVYEFDKLGRQIHDRVTTAGSGIDTAVLRLSTIYEVRGMATKLTSWNNASVSSGSVVNECQFVYNTFGQLITDYQEHGGAVNTSTTPKVQYGYANGSANTIRPTTLTYPNGRVLTYGYGTTNGIDDAVSRISSLIDNDISATHLADYSFVGKRAYVVVDYTQPDVKYTLVDLTGTNDPDTGDIYSGWDRFSRVKDCRWYDYGNATDTVRLKYGYDRASERHWRADLVAQSLGKDFDELYSHDGLHRLKDMQRGLLNGSNTAITSENFAQCWSLDPTSNWYGFREAATGGSPTLVQSRTANKVNEISGITNSIGSAWTTPVYDAAGNATTLPQPADPTKSYTATYDAWNRLIELLDTATSHTVQQNSYDARMYRTTQQSYASGILAETRHFYLTSRWRSIEERLGTSPNSVSPEQQQVWGQRYFDDLLIRDRDTLGDGAWNERLYGLQDANWNMCGVIGSEGSVAERYQYSPYGIVSCLSPSMVSIPQTAFAWHILYAGYRYDDCGLALVRHRVYSAAIGTWLTRDPLPPQVGARLYSYAGARPLSQVDPSGLEELFLPATPAKCARAALLLQWNASMSRWVGYNNELLQHYMDDSGSDMTLPMDAFDPFDRCWRKLTDMKDKEFRALELATMRTMACNTSTVLTRTYTSVCYSGPLTYMINAYTMTLVVEETLSKHCLCNYCSIGYASVKNTMTASDTTDFNPGDAFAIPTWNPFDRVAYISDDLVNACSIGKKFKISAKSEWYDGYFVDC
jgi:RHS repeat-associated protein